MSWSSLRDRAWPRYRLAAVTLEGNQFFPSLALEPQLRLGAGQPFDGARLQADVSAIQELYRRRGFASAEVDASSSGLPAAPAMPTWPWASAS